MVVQMYILVCGNTMCVSTCQVEFFSLENCLALFYYRDSSLNNKLYLASKPKYTYIYIVMYLNLLLFYWTS